MTLVDTCLGCGKKRDIARHLRAKPACRSAYSSDISPYCEPQSDSQLEVQGPTESDRLGAEDLLYHQNRLHNVLGMLGEWTTKARLGDLWKQRIKKSVSCAIDNAVDDIKKHVVIACGRNKANKLLHLLRDRLDIFRDLHTDRQELYAVKQQLPFVELQERKVGPNKNDVAYNLVLAHWLEKLMTYDAVCVASCRWICGVPQPLTL